MSLLAKIFNGIFRVLQAIQAVVVSVVFLMVILFALAVWNAVPDSDPVIVPANAALVLNPEGVIVEQLTARDITEIIVSDDSGPGETLLRDVVAAIRRARDDDRITALVLSLDYMAGAGASQLHYIGSVIEEFKESGKPVLAYSDGFTQSQYLIAAHADEIYLNPFGSVLLTGYGVYPTYYKSGLEKLKATVNVFRVGTYKTFAEPYLRDDMSDDAKEAYAQAIHVLWDAYVEEITSARDIDPGDFRAGIQTIGDRLKEAGGDFAQLALDQGLVDGLMTRAEWTRHLAGVVGVNGSNYSHIDLADYVAVNANTPESGPKVAIVVARGSILDGEQSAGTIGGDTLARLIRTARERNDVKAIVLRIDSGGGSVFASEVIRREVEATQAKGIPVIASMGAVAASGGYWIATTADEIWAAPTTITGSIGIVAILPTFERSLDAIGVHKDGVGTTPLAGGFDPMRPLSPEIKDIIQQSIENGYQRFLDRVADGRDMTVEAVDAVAQGRIWTGSDALALGLVDKLGTLDQAVAAAAAVAELDDYSTIYVEDAPSNEQRLAEYFFADAAIADGWGGSKVRGALRPGPLQRALQEFEDELSALMALNDPNAAYALCMDCRIR